MTIPLLNYINIDDAMLHLVAIEKEITAAVGQILIQDFGNTAVPYMRYEAEGVFPKWLNGLTADKPEDFGIWEDYEPKVIRTELQLGYKTEGYDGTLERQSYTWIAYTEAMASNRPLLTSDEMPNKIYGLLGAQLVTTKPLMPGEIIAVEFQWTLAFFITNKERTF